MSTQPPQTYANHKSNPLLYFAVGAVLAGELFRQLWSCVRAPSLDAAWAVLVAAALVFVWYAARRNAQRMQDRIIRLEMRLRLERLLGSARRAEIEALAVRELVALRFASDAELPALVEEVFAGRLTERDAIKQRVRDWQADHLRV